VPHRQNLSIRDEEGGPIAPQELTVPQDEGMGQRRSKKPTRLGGDLGNSFFSRGIFWGNE
jgi:hypothetical protein